MGKVRCTFTRKRNVRDEDANLLYNIFVCLFKDPSEGG